jgi:endonuclease/exonuclease/phosphatase family metal-dependent hydrolase
VKKFICLLLVAISYLLVTPATTYATSNLVVMSRNIYLGADVGKALALIPDLPAAAQFMWNQMRKTDFQARAKLLADEINDYQPDVIGIQEATIWRCQKNLSSKKTTVYDFVEIMLTQLSGKYEVAEFENTKAYNPGFSISPIPYLTKVNDPEVFQKIFSQDSAFCGFETGDALIVKKQLQPEVINLGNTEYEATYSIVPTLMTIYRGYTWADIKINGIPIRFITTHLESLWDENKLPNSAKQARQLIADTSNTKMPLIVMGDFNSDPRDPRGKKSLNPGEQPVESLNCPLASSTCNAYKLMIDSGFVDAGPNSLDPNNFTWGMNAQLTGPELNRNIAAKKLGNQFGFTDRLDYIIVKNDLEINSAKITGINPPYASDHAGVVASIVINNAENLISPALDAHQPFPISFWQWVGIFLILLLTWVFWRRNNRKLSR